MPARTLVKKTTKTAKKPEKKAPIRVTWADVQAGFKEMHEINKETERTLKKAQEEAWAAIRETQASVKETQASVKENQALAKENQALAKELQASVKETQVAVRETQVAVRETQKNIGGLNNTLGSLAEHIMTPGLPQKFKQIGYHFNRIATYEYAEGVYAEIDAMLENGAQAMVVEVKTTLRQTDIDDHLLRMEKVRKYADEHDDKRQFLGAIAATITDKSTREYALKKGLFVIEARCGLAAEGLSHFDSRGEDVKVTKPVVEPRIW